jgi:O-antigen ligase
MVVAAGAAVLATVVIAWFYTLDLNGRRHTIFNVVALTFIFEAIVTPEAASVPSGVLRPELFGQDFRLPDLFLFAALAARVLAGRWGRIGPIGFAWFPFCAVYFTGVVIGLMVGYEFGQVLFQGKALFYIVGGLVVASGVDIDRLYESIGRVGMVLATLFPIGLIVSLSSLQIVVNTPVQNFPQLGRMSHDTTTILVVFGGAVIATEVLRTRPRWYVAVAGVALLLMPLTRDQRGSYLTLAVVVLTLVILALGQTWRRRSSVTGAQVAVIALTLVAVGAVGLAAGAPSRVIGETFTGQGKQESAKERVILYEQSIELAQERPILGSGVGVEVDIKTVSTGDDLRTTAHNLLLDIWMRVGIVGASFLVIALGVTVWTALSVWTGRATNPVAAIAIVGLLGVAGWLVKALVEPALDKFRLSLLAGLAIGLVAASWRAAEEPEVPTDGRDTERRPSPEVESASGARRGALADRS